MAHELTPSHFTLRLLGLPTHRTLAAAHDEAPADNRLLTIVSAHIVGDTAVSRGWGECSALNHAGYTNESAEGAFELLAAGKPFDPRLHPMASAALAMAMLDFSLREAGQSLAERLGTAGMSAPAGSVVGLGTIPEILAEIEALVGEGYRRVKCKVAPGRILEPIRAVRSSFPDLELHVDANGSLAEDHLDQLKSLAELGVQAVEQPFDVNDQAAAHRLVAESDMVVIADESVTGVDAVRSLARAGAATAVTVKPPKLGGLEPALLVLRAAEESGMQASIGGMLEGGLGRHQLAAIAPMSAFTVNGDLSPAGQWLAADPFDDVDLVNGTILAPSSTGIAGDPDPEILERHTISSATVDFFEPSTS